MNLNATPTTNTDGNAAADSAAADEPEGFESFERRHLELFREVESIAAGWKLAVAIREFGAVGLPRGVGAAGWHISQPGAQTLGAPSNASLIGVDLRHIFEQEFEREEWLSSLLVHELAHAAAWRWEQAAMGSQPELPPCDVSADALREEFRRPPIPRNLPKHIPPFAYHESRFLRACAHVRFRMTRSGIWSRSHWCVNGTAYSLSPLEWYEAALGDETAEREELPVSEAIAGGLPAEFAALWRADVERWEQWQQQRQQPTTTRDNTHGRENSQTRENSEAQGPSGRLKTKDDFPEDPPSVTMIPRNLPT